MKVELTAGWKDRFGRVNPCVTVLIDGDRALVDELYEHLMEFRPDEKNMGWLEFVIE